MINLVVVAAALSGVGLRDGSTASDVLTAAARQRLTSLVERRFGIAPNTQLNILERETSDGLRRVTVFSSTPGSPFEKDLYIMQGNGVVIERIGEIEGVEEQTELRHAKKIMARLTQDESPRVGSALSPVAIVVFVDFECGYCRDAHRVLRQRLVGAADRNVQLLLKHYPLPGRAWSKAAARNSVCIFRQSNELFWDFTDFIFEHQSSITASNLASTVDEFVDGTSGIDRDAFKGCMESTAPDAAILRDQNSAFATGVAATPTFFIDGAKIVGMSDERGLLQVLEQRESLIGRGQVRNAER